MSTSTSVAAMHWAIGEYDAVRAVSFSYGQPNRDAEMTAAGRIAHRRGIDCAHFHLGDGVHLHQTISAPAPGVVGGVSRANMPARNAILLTAAAAYGARLGLSAFAIVIGCNADDAIAFPDCRAEFLSAAETMLRASLLGVCAPSVVAPWLTKTKAEILRWALNSRSSRDDVSESVSCYRGTRCGSCDACTLRARAFEKHHVIDGEPPKTVMHGGDPAREARLK